MPALMLYGKPWLIASDDLLFPELVEGILRAAWFIVNLTLCIMSITKGTDCEDRVYLLLFIGIGVISCFATMMLALVTAYVSSWGTLANPGPRRIIVYFLYARVPLLIIDLVMAIIGSVWLFHFSPRCRVHALLTATKVNVEGNWIWLAISAIFILVLSRVFSNERHLRAPSQARWYNCLSRMFVCGASQDAGSAKAALSDVAQMLGSHFSDTGLTFSDILAGLVLANEKEDNSGPYHIPNPIPPPNKPDWMNLELASRYIFFAAGSYGWPHFSAAYGPMACCHICSEMACPPCRNPTTPPASIQQDNCCFCNAAVLLYMTDPKVQKWDQNDRPQMVYFTLHNKIYEVPFAVFLDHAESTVVIVIRGSLTIEDWVTDLSVVGEPYKIPDNDDGSVWVTGHKGFFESGKYIARKLDEDQILDDIFQSYPDYHLLTTGQSLGAGVAPPLALFLRAKYPDVRCFAYSPPGCVIRDTDVRFTERTICSVIVGDDLIAHMSMQSIDRLRHDIVKGFHACHLPKYKILQFGCIEACLGKDIDIFAKADMENAFSYSVRRSKSSQIKRPPKESRSQMLNSTLELGNRSLGMSTTHNQKSDVNHGDILNSKDLCLPGIIMYVFQPDPLDGQWILSWEQQENFHRIIISASVINHHFPFTVCKVLREALVQQHQRIGCNNGPCVVDV